MTEEKEVSPRALPLRIRSPTLTSDMGREAPDERVTTSVPAKQLPPEPEEEVGGAEGISVGRIGATTI